MRNIFIITSALKPRIGLISDEDRFKQTIRTVESIREKAPGSIILLLDSSPQPVEQEKIDTLKPMVDHYISLFNHTHAMELGNAGLKSPAELYIMVVALDVIKNMNYDDINRVFKITGRAELTDDFHIEDYALEEVKDKYVFKTRNVSWMARTIHCIDTRLWSFDYSMLDEVDKLVRNSYEECMQTGWDIEHVYFKLIPEEKLFEKDVVGLKCQVASDGRIQYD